MWALGDASATANGAAGLSGVLQPYMPIFYVSFLVTLILTPLMRMLAQRHGVVDDPDGKRKVHAQPIAYLGGVSIFLGWMAGVCISAFLQGHNSQPGVNIQVPPGVLMGASVVVLFGLMDDVYSLTPKVKLLGQLLAAGLLLVPGFLGVGVDHFLGNPLSNEVWSNGTAWMILMPLDRYGIVDFAHMATNAPALFMAIKWGALVVSGLIGVFILIAACNATNLLDGLDGLCSGVTGVMALGYLLLAVYLASGAVQVHASASSADPVRITLSLALLGAVLGFLPFNFNPASIFMGDTGSMFLGFMCGTMMLLFGQNGIVRWFLAAVVIFGLPLMDTLLAIVRRKLNGKPIFSPDSNHIHHFLIRRGLSVKKAVLLSYGLAAMFVSFALVIVVIPTHLAFGLYLVLFAWLVVAAFKMGMIFQKTTVPVNTGINAMVIGVEKVAAAPAAQAAPAVPGGGLAGPAGGAPALAKP